MANGFLQDLSTAATAFGSGQSFANVRGGEDERKLARQQQFIQLDDQRKGAMFQDARSVNSFLKSGQNNQALNVLSNRLNFIEQFGGDPTDTREIADLIANGDIQGATSLLDSVEDVGMRATNQTTGKSFLTDPRVLEAELLKSTKGGSKIRDFNSLLAIAEGDPNGETIKGRAAQVELGLMARVSKTAAERIAENEQLKNSIVAIEGEKSAAREEGKLVQQLKHKPSISSAVKLAEKQATERGEVFTSLQRSQAALPGLTTAVAELKELAQISTSTFGGRLFDAAVKETGFGSTKGAVGRAKFIAIVNNQVLPLLKETFGAAFTFQEGEALKATMGDPNASPEEKMAQLDAFIAQKNRDIETKQRQLSQPSVAADITTLSDDELFN